MSISYLKSFILVFVLWGSQHPALKVLAADVPLTLFNALRFLIAFIVLSIFIRGKRLPAGRALIILSGLGMIGISCYGILGMMGIQRSTAINSAVILNTHPVIGVVLGVVFLREKMSLLSFGGICVGFIGAAIVVSAGEGLGMLGSRDLVVGNLLIFAAAICVAVYMSFSKPFIEEYGGLVVTYIAVGAGTLPLCIGAIYTGEYAQVSVISLQLWLVILYVSVVTTAFSWVVWFWGIGRVGIVRIAPFFFLIPVSGVFFSWFFLGEPLTVSVLVGLVLIVLSISVVQREGRVVKQRGS